MILMKYSLFIDEIEIRQCFSLFHHLNFIFGCFSSMGRVDCDDVGATIRRVPNSNSSSSCDTGFQSSELSLRLILKARFELELELELESTSSFLV